MFSAPQDEINNLSDFQLTLAITFADKLTVSLLADLAFKRMNRPNLTSDVAKTFLGALQEASHRYPNMRCYG